MTLKDHKKEEQN
jgi:hypothetical protein